MKRLASPLIALLLAVGAGPMVAQDSAARAVRTQAELERLNTALEFLRGRNARDYAIWTPNGIDEARYVMIGGIEQWITIRGEDRTNSVILPLHGGPGVAPTITIERMTQDGIELTTFLRRELAVDKLIVVGHSWGSILGGHMVKARPELFHVFVGTGQVADPGRNLDALVTRVLPLVKRR